MLSQAAGMKNRLGRVMAGPAGLVSKDEVKLLIWQAKNVNKSYSSRAGMFKSRRHAVLSDVSLQVGEKEFVGLVGESGCGKSTLARLALRLERAESGNMYLAGRSYADYQDKQEFYRSIQIMFQHATAALNPRWQIEQILEEPLRYLTDMPPAKRQEQIREIMAAVSLPASLLNVKPGTLSGGQAQRICLARTIILKPKFIILDEPTSSLDVVIQEQILELLRKLHQESGLAFLMISHDLEAIKRVAGRIVFMHEGRVVENVKTSRLHQVKNQVAKRLVNIGIVNQGGTK
ncbi:dipeptide/oligopeptide/nickel ABC transporter ATP-binding protein [Sporomusa ovata]